MVLLGFIYIEAYCIMRITERISGSEEGTDGNEQIKDTYSL